MTILYRIRGHRRGWTFTPSDFLDITSRTAADQALSRLARSGTIRRIGRGIYDFPRTDARLGVLSPDPMQVQAAIVRRSGIRVIPGGASAANRLGLSTQVPAQSDLRTDGPSRRLVVGRQVIRLRHASPRRIVGAGRPWRSAVDALGHLGRDGVDSHVITRLRRILPRADRKQLLLNMRYAPGWMHPSLRAVAADG